MKPVLTTDTFFSDPRRRGSPEVELATGWVSDDDPGANYEFRWLEATGECYLVRSVPEATTSQKFVGRIMWIMTGWFRYPLSKRLPGYRVEVLAQGMSLSEANERLRGRDLAVPGPSDINWLRRKFL